MKPKQPPGPPMTLGNMRKLGVRGPNGAGREPRPEVSDGGNPRDRGQC